MTVLQTGDTSSKIRLCDVAAMEPGEMRQAPLPDGRKLAVYNVDGRFYVTDDICTHGHASLTEEGTLDGIIVECGWHFGAFDVTTGEAKALPCTQSLRTYAAYLIEGAVWIDTPECHGPNVPVAKQAEERA